MGLLSTALTRGGYLGSALVFAWLYMAGSQCTSASLMAACHGLSVATFLETDIQPSSSVSIRCDRQSAMLIGWSHSPGTGEPILLNTSLPKYMVDGNTLTITNIDRTDEGIYRCVYSNGNDLEQCIYVYGRAVFASCPNDVDGCPGDVALSAEDGGSVSFDATVIHTPGGSCHFQQKIKRVQLIKINPEFVTPDETLLSCGITPAGTQCDRTSGRVSLSRGNDPGYEFVFTLNNISLDRDDGMYRVYVELTHPTTSTFEQINKNFVLQVTPRPPSSTPETDSPSIADATTTDTEPGVATDAMEQHRSTLLITIGVLVPIVVVFIVIAVILTVIVVIWRKRRAHDDPPNNEKAPESHFIAQEETTDDGRGEKVVPNPTAALNPLEVTLTAQEEQPPPYYASVKHEPPVNLLALNMINNGEEPKPTEPSLYDNRSSLVESDFHLPTDTNLNSKPQLVTICEDDEAQQTGRIRYH